MRTLVNTNDGSLSSGSRRSRSTRHTPPLGRLAVMIASPRARIVTFAAFVALVALFGGSARTDISGLVLLRPMAILFCLYAVLVVSPEQMRSVRAALLIVISLIALAVLQLLPLPPGVWSSLSGREAVVEADMLGGAEEIWRPLTLDPGRTWNTLFALFVPLAAVCLVAAQAERSQRMVLLVLVGAGLLSAGLGVLQAIGGNGLHLYEITHSGFPVGLFANKNHQAVLLLWLMLAVSFLAANVDPRRRSAKATVGGALALIAVLFPLLILTGSRAGLMLSAATAIGCGWLLLHSSATRAFLKQGGRRAKFLITVAGLVALGMLMLVLTMLALSTRQSALSRLFELTAGEDLRALYFGRFLAMARDYFPFGSGLGSFEAAFNAYEPMEHLTPQYMNQAHNDPVQLLIEGGLPAAAIMAAGLLWLGRSGWRVWHSEKGRGPTMAVFYCGSILLWLVASVVDYPLRTPLAAMLIAALTAQLGILSTRGRSIRQRG